MGVAGTHSRKGRAVVLTMLLLTAVGRTAVPAEDAGAQWVRDAVVIVSTGSDALGGRVPGSWFAHSGAQIAVSRERAFTGKSSLEIQLKHGAGGCRRIVTAPGGEFRMLFSCRIFVPKGQSFKEMPSVHIWRDARDVVARADPIVRCGEWIESVLEMDRPTGKL